MAVSKLEEPVLVQEKIEPYGITSIDLFDINARKDMIKLNDLGGISGLGRALESDLREGLDEPGVLKHRDVFGANKYVEFPPKSFFALVWGNLQDPIIILLCVAALVSTVLGAAIPEQREQLEWIEGVAIWVAVLVVVSVGAGNDYQKDRQFKALNAKKDEDIKITAMRSGCRQGLKLWEIVVGDVLVLECGDIVHADGILISSNDLVIDEASLTGESEPVKKSSERDPWLRSGTQVKEGSGTVLIAAVGENSEWGKMMVLMGEADDSKTPLQENLEWVATAVGKVGLVVAAACFIVLLIKWCVLWQGFPLSQINNNGPIQFFLYAVTIVVVAVPEGLPLAVTISLAYSMKQMMKDNNFVRVLAACETMGGATTICSDKTGTLTENKMRVVEGWFSGYGMMSPIDPTKLQKDLVKDVVCNMCHNNQAGPAPLKRDLDEAPVEIEPKSWWQFWKSPEAKKVPMVVEMKEEGKLIGSSTDLAFLYLLNDWGINFLDMREEVEAKKSLIKMFQFSSSKKMMSVLMDMGSSYRLYNKGAAEWILRRCTHEWNGSYNSLILEPRRAELIEVINAMAARGLRCIALSYTDYAATPSNRTPEFLQEELEKNLVLLAIVGIKDPVRKEVPNAVTQCQRAGIIVRMVTGDNLLTARHIAMECGILRDGEGLCMEGPDFRNTPKEDMLEKLDQLRVLARSSPEDKLTLVSYLKELGHVVAVTGDGTNDAAALKESDVGLAMGIAGTPVAKEAADIIILDDNFNSIVKSVLWGRCVFSNIRKFLQFQLTVNFVALVTAFVGAVVGGVQPLNVLELLWVNLIMDTMGALALATEKPTEHLLDQLPYGRTEPLINMKMWKHILIQGLYQLVWMFLCLYLLPTQIPRYYITSQNDFYYGNCVSKVESNYNWNVSYSDFQCGAMRFCGFPFNSTLANTPSCPLSVQFPTGVPTSQDQALCGNITTGSCQASSDSSDAQSYMNTQYQDQVNTDYQKPLTVLFNAFVMMQVANEINSRRINDEYNVFEGMFQSHIFMCVILITVGLQAIIVQLLGLFFKTDALDWEEWLATIAIGLGSFPVSFLTRWLTAVFEAWRGPREQTSPVAPLHPPPAKAPPQKQESIKEPPQKQDSLKDRVEIHIVEKSVQL